MEAIVQCVEVQANPPSLNDNTADLDRLRKYVSQALGDSLPLTIPFNLVSGLVARFRQADFAGRAIVNNLPTGPVLVDFMGSGPAQIPAMALDLGTTHLEASLIDLATGQVIASADQENSQIKYGADILSRIHFATAKRRQRKKAEISFIDPGLVELQESIVSCINRLAKTLVSKTGLDVSTIRALSVSGNTTMVHFLLGLDPFTICREPYTPLVNQMDPLRAADIKLEIHAEAPVWIMPSVGSYFGGDLISGILASGLAESAEIRMLIDVGTNAEVVIGNQDWLIACAGAAGPALEGGVARMGMRAGPGAIEYVDIDPTSFKMQIRTIGDLPALGICGSGLIDLVASLYLARIIDIRGKFRDPAREGDEQRKVFMQERFRKKEGKTAFIIVAAGDAAGKEPVLLEQIDLDAMIRSKAAMYAILTTLINQVGLEFTDLVEICVAGAFGRHINPERAVTLGMLPDLDRGVYRAIGNSSLAGAMTVLLDGDARRACADIVRKITYVELNVNQEFMIRFSGSRFIPHTDPGLFPTVPFWGGEEK